MRLTVEDDRESIKRYAHIKPGRGWGVRLCREAFPGAARKCSLPRGHRGPHVAHNRLNKVVAVWDVSTKLQRSADAPKRAVVKRARGEVWTGGVGGVWKAAWGALGSFKIGVEEFALFILFVGFIAFAIDWFLRIL